MNHERGGPPVMEPMPDAQQPRFEDEVYRNAIERMLDRQVNIGGRPITLRQLREMCPVKDDPEKFTPQSEAEWCVGALESDGQELSEDLAMLRRQPSPEDEQSTMSQLFGLKKEAKPTTNKATTETQKRKPTAPAQTATEAPKTKPAAPKAETTIPAPQPATERIPPPTLPPKQQNLQARPVTERLFVNTAEPVISAAPQQEKIFTPVTLVEPLNAESISQWLPESPLPLLPLPDSHYTHPEPEPFAPAHMAEAIRPTQPEMFLPEPAKPASFAETVPQQVYALESSPPETELVTAVPVPEEVTMITAPELLADAYLDLGWNLSLAPQTEGVQSGLIEQPATDSPDANILTIRMQSVMALAELIPTEVTLESQENDVLTIPLVTEIKDTEPTEVLPIVVVPTVESFADSLMAVTQLRTAPPLPETSLGAALEAFEASDAADTSPLPQPTQEVAEKLISLSPIEKAAVTPILESITATVTVIREQVASGAVPDPELTIQLVSLAYELFDAIQACAEPERIAIFVRKLAEPQFLEAIEAEAYRLEHEGTHERKLHFLPLGTLVSITTIAAQAKDQAHNLLGALSLTSSGYSLRSGLRSRI